MPISEQTRGQPVGYLVVRVSQHPELAGPMTHRADGTLVLLTANRSATIFASSRQAELAIERTRAAWLDDFNRRQRNGSPFTDDDDRLEIIPLFIDRPPSVTEAGTKLTTWPKRQAELYEKFERRLRRRVAATA